MATLKELLFGKYAGEGLNFVIEELQKKYSQKILKIEILDPSIVINNSLQKTAI